MRLIIFGIALSTIGLMQIASTSPPLNIPSEPGYHTGVPLPGCTADVSDSGRGSNSYELYLPKEYGKANDVRHPVVLVLGMGAGRNRKWIDEHHLSDWAEQLSPPAILVGVNRLFNAGVGVGFGSVPNEPPIPGEQGMADYWKLVDQIPHAHPTMRLLVSWPSGGAGDGQRVTTLALNHPDKLAGYILGPHPYRLGLYGENKTFNLRKDISVAVLNVTHEAYARFRPAEPYVLNNDADPFDPVHWERACVEHLRRGGNPFALIESVDWKMREASLHEALSYLVRSGLQVKTGVTAAEREAGKWAILKAAAEAATIQDVVEREQRYRSLLVVPGAAEWPEAKEMLEAWRTLVPEAADRRMEPLFRAYYLEAMAEHPLIKNASATANHVAEKWAELQAAKAYQREVAAREAVRAAAAKFTNQQHAGQDIDGLEATIVSFRAAVEISEGTLPSKEAKAWLNFLTKLHEQQLIKQAKSR